MSAVSIIVIAVKQRRPTSGQASGVRRFDRRVLGLGGNTGKTEKRKSTSVKIRNVFFLYFLWFLRKTLLFLSKNWLVIWLNVFLIARYCIFYADFPENKKTYDFFALIFDFFPKKTLFSFFFSKFILEYELNLVFFSLLFKYRFSGLPENRKTTFFNLQKQKKWIFFFFLWFFAKKLFSLFFSVKNCLIICHKRIFPFCFPIGVVYRTQFSPLLRHFRPFSISSPHHGERTRGNNWNNWKWNNAVGARAHHSPGA